MSRATSPLLEDLTNGIRSQVDSLPIAGKLLLFQWLISGLTADIGNVGSLLAPLPTATSGFNIAGGESWNAAPEPDTQTGRSGGYSFRRGLNIPPTVEDGSA